MTYNWNDWLVDHNIDPASLEAGANIDLPDTYFDEQEEAYDRDYAGRSTSTELNDKEQRFLNYWRVYGDDKYTPTPQFMFHPKRKWRADFCFEEQRVIVEIDGMTGGGGHEGHHRSFLGYQSDRERDIQAMALGYLVVRIPTTWLHQNPGTFNVKDAIKLLNVILRYR